MRAIIMIATRLNVYNQEFTIKFPSHMIKDIETVAKLKERKEKVGSCL